MESAKENNREKVDPPKELLIGDSIENKGLSEECDGATPCIWCEIEKKSGKRIGDVTLAELADGSYGNFIFDFITDTPSKGLPQKHALSVNSEPPSPQQTGPSPPSKQPQRQCKHIVTLRGGQNVCLSTSPTRVYAGGLGGGCCMWQRPLTENNPLLMIIGTLTDIFIAITFTLTCWILITRTRDLSS